MKLPAYAPSAEVLEPRKKDKQLPLWHRMYFHEHMIALVRMVGHDGLSLHAAQEPMASLMEAHGRREMLQACEEVLEIDQERGLIYLTDHARKLAVGILGQPRSKPAA